MSKKKSKHSTPAELDPLFKRGAIEEELYQDFWAEWWNTPKNRRNKIIEKYISESIEERVAEGDTETLPLQGSLTTIRNTAEQQAKLIGGYVARRNKNGKFSKRGKYYQAIRKRNSKNPFKGKGK